MGLHMGLGLEQRLEQRIELRQAILVQDLGVKPFNTDGEIKQKSQYEFLQDLNTVLRDGDYFDDIHFGLEINRLIFANPSEESVSKLGRDLSNLIQFYSAGEKVTKKILDSIGADKDDRERELPGKITASWNDVVSSKHFVGKEKRSKFIFKLIEDMNKKNADVESGLDILSRTNKLNDQKILTLETLNKLKEYASVDHRIIPFAQKVLIPVLRNLPTSLDENQAKYLYEQIPEQLFMLDRDLRVGGISENIAAKLVEKGAAYLDQNSVISLPIRSLVENISENTDLLNQLELFADSKSFLEGRDVQRRIYRGLAALESVYESEDMLEHSLNNSKDIKGFAKILNSIDLVHNEPDFSYPFDLQDQDCILKNLKLQLVDKSIKRLNLSDDYLEKYLNKLGLDERFSLIGKIITTLGGYAHYQNSDQLNLLKEIIQSEIDGKFNEWRYSHDKAGAQLEVLENRTQTWKENSTVKRIVGELDALESHIGAVKQILPKMINSYEEFYNEDLGRVDIEEIEFQIKDNESKLKSKTLSKKESKKMGFETSLLREKKSYFYLMGQIDNLYADNYDKTLKLVEGIVKRKSKNPLYESAKWIRETLDQPVYRNARKITIKETDDLEELLRFGENPVPHCQNWKNNSSYNKTLLSFVADANKKLYLMLNGNDKPIGMSMVRLVGWWDEWDDKSDATLLVENFYGNEWSDDYGIALFGSLAQKALELSGEIGHQVRVAIPADHDNRLDSVLGKFSKQYGVEIFEDTLTTKPTPSKNSHEYWDCGRGTLSSETSVSIGVKYVCFDG